MSEANFTNFLEALGAFESGINPIQTYSEFYLSNLGLFDPNRGKMDLNSVNINEPNDLKQMQYHVHNTLGFLGKYQFGEPLLIDLGYYTPAPSGYYGSTATNEWQGTFTGKNGVYSKEDFMSEVQELAIREAFAMNMGVIETRLAQAGKSIDDFLGQEFQYTYQGQVQTTVVTISGILASAHLQGPGGVANLLLNNAVSFDEYGTNILLYMDKFGGYQTPFGTAADDILSGSDISETFDGGGGYDIYQTGDGLDKIIIDNNGQNHDVILDFDITKDVLSLANFSNLTFADLLITSDDDQFALITMPNGQTITLQGVIASDVTESIFVYGPYLLTWHAGSGDTILNNFNVTHDMIDLNYAFATSNLALYEENGSTVIEVVGNNQRMILQDISLNDIEPFHFVKAPVDFASFFELTNEDTSPPPVINDAPTDNSSSSVQQYVGVNMRGINISGAEAGDNIDYAMLGMPGLNDMTYYIEHGMNTIRFPIRWAYITDSADATTASAEGQEYLAAVRSALSELLDAGLDVILDLHSYMRYSGSGYTGSGNQIANADQIYKIWQVIANGIHDVASDYSDKLHLEISNEPNSMATMQVLANNNAGIAAIRDAGLSNMVVLQGNSWSGLHSWHKVGSATDGLSNAEVLIPANIIDPLNNYAISVHQYVDWNGSGTSPVGQSLNDFINYLNFNQFMAWVAEHDVKVLLDEFGSGTQGGAIADINYLLQQVEANPYVEGQGGFLGWAAWVGGHTWAQSNFNYVGPNPDGSDNLQMTAIYLNHLTHLGDYQPPVIDEPPPPPTDDGDDNNNPLPASDDHNLPSTIISWEWGARDLIHQFVLQNDAINLSAFWTSFNKIKIHGDGEGNTVIDLLSIDNHLITLVGVNVNEITTANIVGVSGHITSALTDVKIKYYSFDWAYGQQHLINDFDINTGVLEFYSFSSKSFSDLTLSQNSVGDVVISLPFNSQTITLQGITLEQLSDTNFEGLTGQFSDIQNIYEPPVPDDPPVVPDLPPDEPEEPEVPEVPVEPPVTPPPSEEPPQDDDQNDHQQGEIYMFTWNWGAQTVIDNFDLDSDVLDLSAFWTNFNNLSLYDNANGQAVIDLLDLNNQTIIIKNISALNLTADNFNGVQGDVNQAFENGEQNALSPDDLLILPVDGLNVLSAALGDPLIGTDNTDVFKFTYDWGTHHVVDNFNPTQDKIDLKDLWTTPDKVQVYQDQLGNAVLDLTAVDNQFITLTGVSQEQLLNASIIF